MVRILPATLPVVLWIELTSRCPFDCVFCSRRHDRGAGEHMDLGLFRSLLAQLHQPEILRLNYAGESIHYPHLIEAIASARETGATVELVSAFASASSATVRGIVDAGLHRLSISLHSMDPGQFSEIYGFSSLDRLKIGIAELQRYKRERGTKFPYVDFAFVAMDSNLAQLRNVVAYARDLGVPSISVHPVIRRSDILVQFPAELTAAGDLRPDFMSRLEAQVEQARIPEVAIEVARPDAPPPRALAGLTTCEQNPWETVHVLANGEVVVCEVQDQTALGSLRTQSLSEIWNGDAYREFRSRYLSGTAPSCAGCPWRRTVRWEDIREPFPLRGWHSGRDEGVMWSRQHAAVVVRVPRDYGRLRVRGMLPCGPGGRTNRVSLLSDGRVLSQTANDSGRLLDVEMQVPYDLPVESIQTISIETAHRYCPATEGSGADLRELGFALTGIEFDARLPAPTRVTGQRRATLRSVLLTLDRIDRYCSAWKPFRPLRPDGRWARPGISVIVPERANAERLERCLHSLADAWCGDEPVEIIVVVNGSPRADYTGIQRQHPAVRFIFHPAPLGFSSAVFEGLRHARYEWTYLLNNDMEVQPGALRHSAALRSRDTFAIASRIEMEDPALAAVETNWTDLRYDDGIVSILERDPGHDPAPRGSFYAGGGSSLFQTRILKSLVKRSAAYAPFYWEDVEWGTVAWRHGFRTVFCPASRVRHGYRCTVGKFFAPEEVSRIFQRNRCLYQLRNLGGEVPLESLRPHLLELDERTWCELFSRRALASLFRARVRTAMSLFGEEVLRDRWRQGVVA